uniref:Neur_chan_LBD domain-containing protein n=1 Tax=Panagrellus redivivus TaxID=6233 RepID=A0A7E4WAZ3_PANRE
MVVTVFGWTWEPDCSTGHRMTPQDILDVIMANYSRSQSPEKPVPTLVEVTIQDIVELSVLSNSVTVDFWFSSIWHDSRLAFSHLDPCRQNLSFDDNFEKMLWSPNVCLVNSKSTVIHRSPKANVLLMLLANGTVWLNYRVRAEAPCEMDFTYFPIDSPTCSLVFESYSYNTATVAIDWLKNAVTLPHHTLSATEYHLSGVRTFKHVEYYKAGEWYRLTAEMSFHRKYGFYILQMYLPCYTSVIISMLGFCIDIKALPARIVLLVNSLMTATYQFGSIISSLPPDKKLILKREKLTKRLEAALRDPESSNDGYDPAMDVAYQEKLIRELTTSFIDWGIKVDRICSYAFPASFVLFNIAYWRHYMMQT